MNSKTAPAISPLTKWSDLGKSEHFVQFYKEDTILVSKVSGFLQGALQDGNTAVIIATKAHREAVERQLRQDGVNLTALQISENYLPYDARTTLARFMADGFPDERLFNTTIGAIMARATQNGRAARAFGEMVAILWSEGNQKAAIRLEELWNDLAHAYSFCLFCAYPLESVLGERNADSLAHVCRQHSRVISDDDHIA